MTWGMTRLRISAVALPPDDLPEADIFALLGRDDLELGRRRRPCDRAKPRAAGVGDPSAAKAADLGGPVMTSFAGRPGLRADRPRRSGAGRC